jgi:ribonuclease R
MRSRLGETFEGRVTALVGSGVFVALPDPFVDVLVRYESLGPDGYALDEQGLRVVGSRSGERISIGDAMRVQIEEVSLLRRITYGRRLLGEVGGPGQDRKTERKTERKSLRRVSTRPETSTTPAPRRTRRTADLLEQLGLDSPRGGKGKATGTKKPKTKAKGKSGKGKGR